MHTLWLQRMFWLNKILSYSKALCFYCYKIILCTLYSVIKTNLRVNKDKYLSSLLNLQMPFFGLCKPGGKIQRRLYMPVICNTFIFRFDIHSQYVSIFPEGRNYNNRTETHSWQAHQFFITVHEDFALRCDH